MSQPFKKFLFYSLIPLTLLSYKTKAQDIAAYVTPYRQFVIQDKYDQKNAEPLPPLNFKVGRQTVAYNDNAQVFKIYYKNETHTPTRLLVNNYKVSDNLVVFEGGGVLNVFDKGETTFLSSRVDYYDMSDSLVFFNDQINQKVYAYYNGENYELENFLSNQRIQNYKLGDNILGYVNFANQLKVFYHGETEVLEYNDATILGAGRDIVSYKDINGSLKVYFEGDTYTLDDFSTDQVWVGDRMMAFISSDGNFKLFYDAKIKNIGYFTPEEVGMQDFVFWYKDFNNYFQVFHDGEFTQLDTQYPDGIQAKYNSMIFRNRFDQLTLFRDGEKYNITTLPVKDLEMYYDVITYTLGLNSVKVFGEREYN